MRYAKASLGFDVHLLPHEAPMARYLLGGLWSPRFKPLRAQKGFNK